MPLISPPPPMATKTAERFPFALADQLVADGALPGDDVRIVEGRDQRHPARALHLVTPHLRVGVGVTSEDDLGTEVAHGLHLDVGRGLRHHDHGRDAEPPRGEGDALRVITGARGNHAACALVWPQVRDLVVGAAQLEAEDGLQILALEQDLRAEPAREPGSRVEGRLTAHVVHAARQDEPQHLVARSAAAKWTVWRPASGMGRADYMRRNPTRCLR